MSTDFVVHPRKLDFAQCRQLFLRPPFDVERLLHMGGQTTTSWEPTLVPMSSAIDLLIRSRAMDGGFEPTVITRWLPHLRNETLLTLGENIDAWSCPSPIGAWDAFVPSLYGQSRDVRPRICRQLKCSLEDAAATVHLYSASDIQAFRRFEDAAPRSGAAPRHIICADDLADRVKQVCGTVLFTVRPPERAAA